MTHGKMKRERQTADKRLEEQGPRRPPPHHVGVRPAGHALAGVQVQELVDLGGGQPIPHLQLLDDEYLAREGLLAHAGVTK